MPEMEVIVGAPTVGDMSKLDFRVPYGHIDMYRKAQLQGKGKEAIYRRLLEEYTALLFTLRGMGMKFRIAVTANFPIDSKIKAKLAQEFEFVTLPSSINWQVIAFPRDLAVMVNDRTVLVCHDANIGEIESENGIRYIPSHFGEGGRVHVTDKVMLVAQPFRPEGRQAIGHLQTAGKRIGFLPLGVNYEESVFQGNEASGYTPDDHLDRFCGVFQAPDGQLHLVVDPEIWSGWVHPLRPPIGKPKETLDQWRSICTRMGIGFHVPSYVKVPGSLGFLQFQDGRILMTSDEPAVRKIVAEFHGQDQVFETIYPWVTYASFCKASLHCMVNELPSEFISMLEKLV